MKNIIAVALLFFAMNAGAQNVDLWIEGGQTIHGKTCIVSISTKNNSNVTIGQIVKLNYYDKRQNFIGNGQIMFRNVRPGHSSTTDDFVNNITCGEIARVAYRGIEWCSANGVDSLDCRSFNIRRPKGKGVIDIGD